MTYLIFGSKGFVASNMINYLNKENKKFINITGNEFLTENNLSQILENIFYCFNQKNEFICNKLIDDFVKEFNILFPNTLINTALIPTGLCHKSKPSKTEMLKVNFYLPYIYALISIKLKVRKIIYISSAGIYSKITQPIDEKKLIFPENDYTFTKFLTELKIENYLLKHKEIKTKLFILRPTLIYGENTKGTFKLLEKMVIYGIPIPLKNNKIKKSLLSIKNLTKFVEKIYEYETINSKNIYKFLLTDDQQVTLEQIIFWISNIHGKKGRVLRLNAFCISCLRIIFPIYKLFNKLNSDLIYTKSKLPPELNISMPSYILKNSEEN